MSQKYTKEFKEAIVQLHEAGQPVSDLVKEYGVANQNYILMGHLYGKSEKSIKRPIDTWLLLSPCLRR